MLAEDISRLIGRIYAESGDAASLARLIDGVVQATGSSTAMLAVANTAGGTHDAVSFHGRMCHRRADTFAEYAAYRYADDPSFGFVTANPRRGVLDSARDLAGHPFRGGDYHRWLSDAGVSHWLLRYGSDPGATFAISLHSGADHEPHGERERDLFALLFPHFENAVRIAARPPLFDAAGDALLIVGAEGRLRAANPAAERLLAARDGLLLDRDCVRPAMSGQRTAWSRLLRSALEAIERGGCGGAIALARADGRRPLAATVEPMPAQAGLARLLQGALVRVVDPDAGPAAAAPERWRQLWGLSAAEARAAAMLLETGCDLRRAGDRLGLRYATMRTHVAALLAKTGTSGQPELMRLLARLSG